MTDFLISPAERPPITTLGTVSTLPERLGVDIAWQVDNTRLAGAQRKTVMDLISSVQASDKRLGRELQQMQQLAAAFLVIEGTPAWDREGNLVDQYRRWSLKQHTGVLLSVQRHGVMVLQTRNPLETCAMVEYLATWTQEKMTETTTSLLYRPAQKNGWGKLTDRKTAIHILTGMPDIGIELAERIFDHYGQFPCRHDLAEHPLEEIHGIGKVIGRKVRRVFGLAS